jgi:hypothetical protein
MIDSILILYKNEVDYTLSLVVYKNKYIDEIQLQSHSTDR